MELNFYKYRKQYQEITKIILDNSKVVHHLDGNRQNNNLKNLVHIDKFSHCNYHKHLICIYKDEVPLYMGDIEQKSYDTAKRELGETIIERDLKIDELFKEVK